MLEAEGIRAGKFGGAVRLTVNGPMNAWRQNCPPLRPSGRRARAHRGRRGRRRACPHARRVVAAGRSARRQQSPGLLALVRLTFTDGVAIDRLRLGLRREAVLDVSGRVGSALDLTVALRNLPADLAAVVAPDLAVDGTVQADARLTGTTARPAGTVVKLSATGLRARSGPGRGCVLAGQHHRERHAERQRGPGRRAAACRVVAAPGCRARTDRRHRRAGPAGDRRLDLTLANAILAAGGRRVRGRVTPDLTITGTAAAPRVGGTVQLADGEVEDAAAGLHLTGIVARVQGDGSALRIAQFSAKAGPGTIGAGGTVGVLAPGLPLDLTLTARNARPLSSDLVSAELDADLTIRGEAVGLLTVAGSVRVRRADLRVPERLPTSIAVLPISVPGAKPAPPAAASSDVALNLTVDAPQQIFIRGRGLDAEFGGSMKLTGSVSRLRAEGGLNLRRGVLNLVGHALDFSEGLITFDGGSIADPSIRLVANSTSANVVATLTVGGTARNPKITLSSVPELPQDEVLAHLLFGKGVGALGPLEIAGIASGLATLTGSGGSIIGDPLDKMRQGLGLDRLAIGSGPKGGATLEAGRYLAPGVYLGAKQSASGGGAQASVQVDIAKGLKLEGTAGTGGTSAVGAAGASNGTSVGLTYQFEY